MAKSKLDKARSRQSEDEPAKQKSKQIQKLDPALANLFQKSLGPVKPIAKPRTPPSLTRTIEEQPSPDNSNEADSATEGPASETIVTAVQGSEPDIKGLQLRQPSDVPPKTLRKRKRGEDDFDIEGRYLDQLVQDEVKEEERRSTLEQVKRQKLQGSKNADGTLSDMDVNLESGDASTISNDDADGNVSDIPQHESIVASKEELDLEKSSRTVFLANVSTLAIKSKAGKKELLDHLASFIPLLPDQDSKHNIESLRFRSTAFATSGIPRKAAFVKKELMDTTTKSTNAYVVYSTQLAAREASRKLNGSMVLDRHLRVDSVAHPAKIDHRRCVFVGNLGFVDDVTNMHAAEDEENDKRPRKAKEPADVEEGLWRQFGKAGVVESVRVVRDKTTRVGKGFAYVQFENANDVEKALLYNEKKFPPLLPRILRVTRAKNINKVATKKEKKLSFQSKQNSIATYSPRVPAKVQSVSGRAGKLLGRAGAAQLRAAGEKRDPSSSKVAGVVKSLEAIVFEGYRASRQQGKGALKLGGSGKAQSKPRSRSSRRGAEFKAKGKKKART